MASLLFLLPLVLLWVLFVRPQQKRMRQVQAMVASLEVGDDVITTGGIYGTITDADADSLWVEIAPDVTVRILRSAVSQRVPTDLDELVAEREAARDDDADDDDADDDGDSPAASAPGSNGFGAGVPNGTTPPSPRPEPATGDDDA